MTITDRYWTSRRWTLERLIRRADVALAAGVGDRDAIATSRLRLGVMLAFAERVENRGRR